MEFIFMIKANKIIGIVAIILVTLCSCTNENVETVPDQLLKKIVEVSIDGTTSTTTLVYDGNKIRNIDRIEMFSEFYYTGDIITKVIETDKKSQHINTLDFLYTNAKLTKIKSTDNYVLNYIYNKDETVSYEKLIKDVQNNDIRVYHGTLFFLNENIIKDEKILDDAGTGILSKKTINTIYDDKKNALSLILGFNKLLNNFGTPSMNNSIIRTEDSFIKQLDNNETVSAIKRYDCKNKYNSNGYPTEIESETLIFGGSDTKHLKSQLFYN